MNGRLNRVFIVTLIVIMSFAALALVPVSAGGGITAGPWRDINPTQYSSAGDGFVPGPNVPLNGIYVRTAGFGAVGAGDAWAVGGCGPTTASAPFFPFSLAGCASPEGGGTVTHYDGFSWTIQGPFAPFSTEHSFYTGVNFCTSPGAPSVGLCSPNGDGSDGWIVGGNSTAPIALYVTSSSAVTPDVSGLPLGGYLTSVFETCHVDNDPNGKGCSTGLGAGDAYAAGTNGAGFGVIYEYTGGAPAGLGSWHTVHTSTTATIYNSIYMFVDSFGTLEGFAAGDKGIIARFSSSSWNDIPVGPSTTTFNGVAVDNGNPIDAWAVGYDQSVSPCLPCGVIYRFSSSGWTGLVAPSPVDGVALESVFLVSGSEGWIVGTKSTILHGTGLPGSSFTSISTAGSNPLYSATGTGIDLNSVSFQSSGAGWSVGTYGVILQTSDSSCDSIVQASSPLACWGGQTSIEQTTNLTAVYENSPSDAWAGGLYDYVNNFPSLIHWDGNKWHRANVFTSAGTTPHPDIFGIYMVGSGEGYAVGAERTRTGATCLQTFCPAALTWNVITPNSWQAVKVAQCGDLPAGCNMTSVYFATIGPVDGWAVGSNGGIWTYNKASTQWVYTATGLPAGFFPNLNSVFINNPGNNNPAGWAVGDAGVVLYLSCSGSSCLWNVGSITGLSPTVNLYGVYFANSNDGWIVGSQNTIITTTNGGNSWVLGSAANAPSTAVWTSVHVDTYGTPAGSGNGWAVGYDSATPAENELTAWWNGGTWTAMNLPTGVASGLGLYSVFTTSPTDGWAVGAQPICTTPACPNSLTGIFHLDPAVPPIAGQQVTSTSSSSSSSSSSTSNSVATTTSSLATSNMVSNASTTSGITTSSLTTTVVSTSVSTMTVVSTPTTTSSSTTISVSTPMVLPAVPGFPWESIIAGIILGLTALAVVRRRKK